MKSLDAINHKCLFGPVDFAPPDVVSARLRDARKSKGLSQWEAAERLGVTQPAVSAWENGHPPAREHWKGVSDLYERPMLDLFFDEGR